MKFNDDWALRLTGILVVIYILQAMFPQITDFFILDANAVLSKPWTLVTSIFLHAGPEHLMLNGFALFLFGSILENIIGSRKFLIYFFAGGIVAAVIFVLGVPVIQAVEGTGSSSALGASGAIFGVLGILTILRPNLTVFIGFLPLPMWAAAIVWAGLDFLGIFIPDNIANFAHLGGLFTGLAIGLVLTGGKISIGSQKPYQKIINEKDMRDWERTWMDK